MVSSFFFFNLLIYVWLRWVFLATWAFSSAAHELLFEVAPLVEALGHTGSVAVARGLSCSMACGIFPDQESN